MVLQESKEKPEVAGASITEVTGNDSTTENKEAVVQGISKGLYNVLFILFFIIS